MSWEDGDEPRRRRPRQEQGRNGWQEDGAEDFSDDPLDDPFADPFDADWNAPRRVRDVSDVPPPPPAGRQRRPETQRRQGQSRNPDERARAARPNTPTRRPQQPADGPNRIRRPGQGQGSSGSTAQPRSAQRRQRPDAPRQRRRPTRREGSDYTRPEFYERWDPATYEPIEENPTVERARDAGEWVLVIGVAVAVALLVKAFAFQAFYIPSESMVPTLEINDRVLVNKLTYKVSEIDRGDVVVFERPPAEPDKSIEDLIKRVIATEGQVVSGSNGIVYVDGQALDEEYLPRDTVTQNLPPTRVPEGHLWVMGDNRGRSSDSRVFGPISEDLVIGEAFMRILPVNKIGLL